MATFAEIQLRLRAFLLKLSVCEASLIDLPEGVPLSLVVYNLHALNGKPDLTWTTFLELRDPTATPSTEAAHKAVGTFALRTPCMR